MTLRITLEDIEAHEQQKPRFPDDVFHANMKGNGLWPQTGIGVGLYSTAAAIKSPSDLKTLLESEPTEEQLKRAYAAMEGYHGHGDIPQTRKTISPDTMKGIITASKFTFAYGATLGNELIFEHRYEEGEVSNIIYNYTRPEIIEHICAFWDNPQSHPLKKSLVAGAEFLDTAEAKELSAKYRDAVYAWGQYKQDKYEGQEPSTKPSQILKSLAKKLLDKSMGELESDNPLFPKYVKFLEKLYSDLAETKIDIKPGNLPSADVIE